jgi:hypothetical protein
VRVEAVLAAAGAAALSVAQRRLSTVVRHARRDLGSTEGTAAAEAALRALAAGVVLLAAALVAARLT